jgi:4-hydroxybenzoate polyprenyltransferase
MPGYTDIRRDDWIDRRLPPGWRPYARLARLDRPIGWWLLLLPCWWSLALASPGRPPILLFILFWIGAVVMRGAGCTLNDIVDRHLDAAVERTRVRPIPSGQVSVFQAFLFMAAQCLIGALVLLCLRRQAIELGLGVLVLVVAYPFMKRITFWPQLFLGLNFNWGALIAWATVTGHVAPAALALYVAGIAWTLGYDTIYAHQDKADDVAAGIKSTALLFAGASKLWIGGFYAVTVLGVTLALMLEGAHDAAYLAVMALALHFAWQVLAWRMDDQADSLAKFKSNRVAGLIVTAACLLAGW